MEGGGRLEREGFRGEALHVLPPPPNAQRFFSFFYFLFPAAFLYSLSVAALSTSAIPGTHGNHRGMFWCLVGGWDRDEHVEGTGDGGGLERAVATSLAKYTP